MLVSVFTPTNDDQFLGQAYDSLARQDHADWEWVLVPNGAGFSSGDFKVPPRALADPRVRVERVPQHLDTGHVGALKLAACEACRGRVLVELDHDDRLAPTALGKVAGEVEAGAGFVYSDFIVMLPDGGSERYAEDQGWRHYEWTDEDRKTWTAHRAFDATPRALSDILFGPNHVRAWEAETYRRIGGHDPTLPVCDDMDLVIRTYLSGAKFAHVREPLYYYRERHDGQNTYRLRADNIVDIGRQVADRTVYRMVGEWCRREKLPSKRLLASATVPAWGFVAQPATDVVLPVPPPGQPFFLPMPDSSLGALQAYDYLHMLDPGHVADAFREFYRVLAPGGWLLTNTPAASGCGIGDPRTRSLWNRYTFGHFSDAGYAARLYDADPPRFQLARSGEYQPTEWMAELGLTYVVADLVALKDGYHPPGPVRI